MRPPITIVCTTWLPPGIDGLKRLDAVTLALKSWRENLIYDGELRLHVADDGTGPHHFERLQSVVSSIWSQVWYTQQSRQGVGASLNQGLKSSWLISPLVLYAVDDWRVIEKLDLTPWADLLIQFEDVGLVRFFPHPDLSGWIRYFWDMQPTQHGLVLDRHHYAFATRPFLGHKRFFDTYGSFTENVNAYQVEEDYNRSFCNMEGPNIVLALPPIWEPIDSVELAGVQPG